MKSTSDQAPVFLLTLFVTVLFLVPFVIVPWKNWFVILILFDVPILFIVVFGILSDELGTSSNPIRLWNVSSFVIGLILFLTSAAVLYLNNYPWSQILLYSAGLSVLAIMLTVISIFIRRRIKQNNPTHPE